MIFIKRKNFIKQQDESDCGIACLSMVLHYYKSRVPFHKLRKLSGTDTQGTSAYGLKVCAEKLGFNCKVVQTDGSVWKSPELRYPLIAHIVVDNIIQHYVVVYKKKGNKLIIGDPAKKIIKQDISEFEQQWTGILFLITPSKSYQPVKENLSGFTSFVPILLHQKATIFHIVLSSILITIFGIIGSYYFQGIIDYFIPNQTLSTLNVMSIGLIVLFVFRVVFEYIRNYLLVILGQKMSISVMLSYFKHVLKLPMDFFVTRKSGEIISRFLDASKIVDMLASATLSIFLDIGMVIAIGSILFIQNMTLFFITLSTIPIYCLTIFSFMKLFDKANEEEMGASATVNSSIIESLKGIETIKANNGEDRIYEKVDREFIKMMKKSFHTANLNNIQQGVKLGIQLISSSVVLWIGAHSVISGAITIGQLITFNALLVFFTDPLQNIINLQVKIQTAQVANRRINEIFQIETEDLIKKQRKNIKSTIFDQSISIKGLSFSYGLKEPILNDVSCTIPAKGKVALVGVSGSGKSTLAKLLIRYYEPTAGNIFFKRMNAQDIDSHFIRSNITYIPQEAFFFKGTIIENLMFGIEKEIDFETVINVCEQVKILQFIEQQAFRFDMQIEEGGANLSGGQKQRLSIARALLRDSKVLILDEATSGMDTLLEHEVVQNLLQMKDKTIIFIAHRLSIAKACDLVLVLHQGQLVEQGIHNELRNNGGIYQKLWEIG